MFQTPITFPTTSAGNITKLDPYSSATSCWPWQSPAPPTRNWTGINAFPASWNNTWNWPANYWNRFSGWPSPSAPFFNRPTSWPATPGLGPTNVPPSYYSSELSFFPNRPGNFAECASCQNPICYDNAGNRWFRLCFDLRGFRPDECCVCLDAKNRCICVEANHDCNESSFSIKRNYNRKYCFPEEFKIDFSKCDFKCWLGNDGVLVVEAPLPGLSLEEARFWTPTSSAFPFQATPFPSYTSPFGANAYPVCFKTSSGGREQEQQQQRGGGGQAHQTQQSQQPYQQHQQHQQQQTAATSTTRQQQQPTAPTQETHAVRR